MNINGISKEKSEKKKKGRKHSAVCPKHLGFEK